MTKSKVGSPLFWRFQLAGWAGFILASFPLKLELTGSLSTALLLCAARDGSSFLLTLALRSIYRKFWSYNCIAMGALIVVACPVAGLLQYAFFFLMRAVMPLQGEALHTHWMEFETFYERTGLLFAWTFLYFGVRHTIESAQRGLQLALLEIQMLRAQMNPHFLYNAFNTLQAGAGKSPDQLKRLIQALSEYFRYSLENRNRNFIPLSREIDAIKNYLVVEEARFRDELVIDCRIDESTRSLLVPGVVIQPLIENAIKYGRMTSPKPVTVRLLTSRPDPHSVRIEVANMGHWVEPDLHRPDSGVGLENLRRRLALIYPKAPELRISKEADWVTVQVDLPIKP